MSHTGLGKLLLALCLLGAAAVPAAARQESPSASKRAAIQRLMRALNVSVSSSAVFDALISQYHEYWLNVTLNDFRDRGLLDSFTPEERARAEQLIKEFSERVFGKIKQRVVERFATPEQLESILVPLYDRHFSEADLNELAAFFETAAGRKFVEASPRVTAEFVAQYTGGVGTQVSDLAQAIINEEMEVLQAQLAETFKKPAPPKRTRAPRRRAN